MEELCLAHRYDDAIRLATLWGVNVEPVVGYFTDVVANLHYNVLPQSGDPAEYLQHNDISGRKTFS